ncbi:MAG TPA: lytic transglycosylase domain-containing protein [Chitinophagaceae bacterium]
MLKKTLLKTGLLFIALFVIVKPGKANSISEPGDSVRKNHPDTIQWLYFDPSLLKVTGIIDSSVAAPSISMNRQAVSFVKKYIKENNNLLTKIRESHPNYFVIMDSVLTKYGVPVELKYLAIIESKLKTTAVSPVGAVGAWQMMASTARLYSLKVTSKYDERKYFYKSTVAAAKMLSDLYKQFDDWLLVVAAYNCGPGGVYKAIKKSGSKNFWKLQQFLPAETRAHVKRFIGTHYHYEQQGSVATLTKDEVTAYRKTMIAFVEKQNNLSRAKSEIDAIVGIDTGKKEEKFVADRSGELNLTKEQ